MVLTGDMNPCIFRLTSNKAHLGGRFGLDSCRSEKERLLVVFRSSIVCRWYELHTFQMSVCHLASTLFELAMYYVAPYLNYLQVS